MRLIAPGFAQVWSAEKVYFPCDLFLTCERPRTVSFIFLAPGPMRGAGLSARGRRRATEERSRRRAPEGRLPDLKILALFPCVGVPLFRRVGEWAFI